MRRSLLLAGLAALLVGVEVGASAGGAAAVQWRVVYRAPATTLLTDIANAGPTSVWVVGTSGQKPGALGALGKPLVARWDGKRWQVLPGPLPGGVRGKLSAVAVLGPNDVWVAGARAGQSCEEERLLAHWNGKRWKVLPNPPIPSGRVGGRSCGSLHALGASGADDVWAAGPVGERFVAERWDGISLSLMVLPISTDGTSMGDLSVGGVAPASPRDVWMVGLIGEHAWFLAHWNGRSWRETNVYGGGWAEREWLEDVVALRGPGRWAVGSVYDEDEGQLATSRYWDGGRWRAVDTRLPFGTYLVSVDAISPRDVWAAGDDWSKGKTKGLVVRWNGTRWARVPLTVRQSTDLSGITVASPRDVWVIGARTVARYSGG